MIRRSTDDARQIESILKALSDLNLQGPTSNVMNLPCIEDQIANHTLREPSRARLKAIQAILKTLLESPSIESDIDSNWVRKTSIKGDELTDAKCQVIVSLANILCPYIPKNQPNSTGPGYKDAVPHVALRVLLVILVNSVLLATEHPEFACRIALQIFPSSLHILTKNQLNNNELFCCKSAKHFDIKDAQKSPLTDYKSVTVNDENGRSVIGSLFDLDKIETLCQAHGLKFSERKYEERNQKRHGSNSSFNWEQEFQASKLSKEDAELEAENASASVKRQESIVAKLRKKVTRKQDDQICTSNDLRKGMAAMIPLEKHESSSILNARSFFQKRSPMTASSEQTLLVSAIQSS
ncbi:hypothetical protein BGZ76_004286 [Entomortierella beljakovae]|nr:hypothetical protein BGZ76_004286 [Entomortierella beljakovae]